MYIATTSTTHEYDKTTEKSQDNEERGEETTEYAP